MQGERDGNLAWTWTWDHRGDRDKNNSWPHHRFGAPESLFWQVDQAWRPRMLIFTLEAYEREYTQILLFITFLCTPPMLGHATPSWEKLKRKRKNFKLLPSSIVKVRIIFQTIFWFNLPLNYVIWSNLTLNKIYLFYLAMHKRILELNFCRMIADNITNFKQIFQEFFIIILTWYDIK